MGIPYPSPGRYFAANELKAILAYIAIHYDLKLGGDGSRPPDSYIATAVVPALHVRVLFRKRGASGGSGTDSGADHIRCVIDDHESIESGNGRV